MRTTLLPLALLAALTFTATASARDDLGRSRRHASERTWTRGDASRLENLADRLERDTNSLRRTLDKSLDGSRLDGTRREDDINAAAERLENAADRLERATDEREPARAAANAVFEKAEELDDLVRRRALDSSATRDWRRVDADLAALARFYPSLAARADRDDERSERRGRRQWREHRQWRAD